MPEAPSKSSDSQGTNVKNLLAGLALALATVLPACTTVVEKTVVVEQGEVARFDELRDATVMLVIRNEDGQPVGSCSAVVVAPHMLLTAAHCDAGASFLVPGIGAGVKVRKDESKDLMLVFVEKMKLLPMPVSKFDPILDTAVVTVGFPLGVGEVATEGRVQDGPLLDGVPEEEQARMAGYMLISSPIVFGNSGGPVFAKINGEYQVVGIVSAVAALGFGIPVSHLGFAVKATTIQEFLKG